MRNKRKTIRDYILKNIDDLYDKTSLISKDLRAELRRVFNEYSADDVWQTVNILKKQGFFQKYLVEKYLQQKKEKLTLSKNRVNTLAQKQKIKRLEKKVKNQRAELNKNEKFKRSILYKFAYKIYNFFNK